MINISQGEFLVTWARRVIEEYLKEGTPLSLPEVPDELRVNRGVFVTLEKLYNQKKQLRGCIGHPYPDLPLIQAVRSSAISAATEDPRFPRVALDEMDSIIVEITVLTEPQLIKVSSPEEYPEHVTIGKDGLIVEKGFRKGLLLPQVPIDQEWDETLFLAWTCRKAGLPETAWLDSQTKIYKFQGIIFEETQPRGSIIQRQI